MRRWARPGTSSFADLALLAIIAVGVIPIVWIVVAAFLPNRAIVSSRWEFPFWTGNFDQILADGVFLAQLRNSLLIVAGTVVLCLVIGALGGYVIAKLRPPRWVLIPTVLLSACIPLIPPATLIPGFYLLLADLGLLGSLPGLILLNAFLNVPFALFFMASAFERVPEELREAALVDGAGELRSAWSVMLPLVKPALASVSVFVAIMAWNEFLMGLTMTAGGATAPVTAGIAALLQPFAVTWGQMAAAGTIASLPIILLTLVANRFVVSGLTAGAVKG